MWKEIIIFLSTVWLRGTWVLHWTGLILISLTRWFTVVPLCALSPTVWTPSWRTARWVAWIEKWKLMIIGEAKEVCGAYEKMSQNEIWDNPDNELRHWSCIFCFGKWKYVLRERKVHLLGDLGNGNDYFFNSLGKWKHRGIECMYQLN